MNATPRRAWSLPVGLVLVAGLFVSLQVALQSFVVDADASQAAMLWDGIHRYGPGFVTDWVFTPDNWLLSLYPVTFLLFAIVGPKATVVIVLGWVIFAASLFTTARIARVVDARRSALIVPALLAFSGLYAHHAAMLSYPQSHNVTNLFGLVAFLGFLAWITSRRTPLLLVMALALIAGGLSDPWLVASYALPLAVTSLVLLAQSGSAGERRQFLLPLLATAASITVVGTRAFGAFGFLPALDFALGGRERILANAGYVLRDVGGLLNVVPGATANALVPALASLLVAAGLAFGAVRAAASRAPGSATLSVAFFGTIALSVGGTALAVTVSATPALDNAARFLVNAPYLLLVGLAVLLERAWQRASSALRLAAIGAGLLFVIAGAIDTYPAWRSPSFAIKDGGAKEWGRLLAGNGLTYGYGPYWGAKANAVTWLSGFDVRVRPVVFDHATGMLTRAHRAQTSPRWLLPGDAPPNQQSTFVIVKNDGEQCPDVGLCIAGVSRQFGPPDRRLDYDGATVLVWSRALRW